MAAVLDASSPADRLCGDIRCEVVRGSSVLTHVACRSPLKLLTPRTRGRARRVVLSSFGGGLVAGDQVPVRVEVGPGAACVLSTQSSSKVYRSDGRPTGQSLEVTVADDGLLVVLPDPLCCYAGAAYAQAQSFDLTGRANLVWLDWITSGRWARSERWAFTHLSSRTDLHIDGRLALRETIELASDAGVAFCMGRFDCYAVLTIAGPMLEGLADHAASLVQGWPLAPEMDVLAAGSRIEGGVVIRIMGPRAEIVQDRLRELLRPLGELLGDDPWARKW